MMKPILYEYEDTLIGRKRSIGNWNFKMTDREIIPGGYNQEQALLVIRHCIEKILHWNEKDALRRFDWHVIDIMKLRFLVRSCLDIPAYANEEVPRYILSLLYPDIHVSYYHCVMSLYKKIQSDPEDKNERFPQNFFMGIDGFYNYCACLRYVLSSYKTFEGCEEIYAFLLSPEGSSFLQENKLLFPILYNALDLIDCIHYVTGNDPYSDFYCHYYRFLTGFYSRKNHAV